jgi:hypothetical protein
MVDVVTQWPDDPHVAIVRHSRQPGAAPRLLDDLSVSLGQSKSLSDAWKNLVKDDFDWRSDLGSFLSKKPNGPRLDTRLSNDLGGLNILPK